MKEKAVRLSFMYDRFKSVGGYFLKFWIENEEFQDAILTAMEHKTVIDEGFVLGVMRSIYESKMLSIQNGEQVSFNYKWAKRAIKKLEAQV